MIGKIVKKYAEFAGLGDLSPHDLRRTAITRALDQGFSIREVQMMSGHKDTRSLMKYDHSRENLEKNPVNKLSYEDRWLHLFPNHLCLTHSTCAEIIYPLASTPFDW